MILITGGAGFVGSHLAVRMKKAYPEKRIIAFDNLKRRGSELNLLQLRESEVEFVHGDIRHPSDLDFSNVEWILECSAEPSALAGIDGSTDYLVHTNLLGTYHCLELARKNNAGMIFLSTSRVYPVKKIQDLQYDSGTTRFELKEDQDLSGVSCHGINEEFPLVGPRTLYGTTKLASELMIAEYAENFSLPMIINRCGVLTGPWQMGKVDQGVVVLWMARHFFGGSLSYIGYEGSGFQVRDMLHIEDLADLIELQLKEPRHFNGKTFNVGGGKGISSSLLELTSWCEKITGNSISIQRKLEPRQGDVPWFITDSRRILNHCVWRPKRNLETILKEIHQWMDFNQDQLRPILS